MPMPLIPDMAVFQRKLATLPLETYQAGETVLSAASTTGRLLILKKGAVAVVKEGVEIARVTEPGAVFGELSVLLDQPHTADVRALEVSQFHVADAATILRVDPIALLYVATVLAQRLDSANRGLLELKRSGSGRRAAQRNWENGREDRGPTGRHRCQSDVCRLSFTPDAIQPSAASWSSGFAPRSKRRRAQKARPCARARAPRPRGSPSPASAQRPATAIPGQPA